MPALLGWKSYSFLRWSFFGDKPIFAIYATALGEKFDFCTIEAHIGRFRALDLAGLLIKTDVPDKDVSKVVYAARRHGILTALELPLAEARMGIPEDTLKTLDALIYTIELPAKKVPMDINPLIDGRTYLKVFLRSASARGLEKARALARRKGVEVQERDLRVSAPDKGCGAECFRNVIVLSPDGGIYYPCVLAHGRVEEFSLGSDLAGALETMAAEVRAQASGSGFETPCPNCNFRPTCK